MKRIILIASTLFVASQIGFAQPNQAKKGDRKEKIEAMKVAYITDKLDLTPKEAQQFWPVFNEFDDKLKDLRQGRKKDTKDGMDNLDQLSDKEVETLIDSEIGYRQRELDLLKEYHAKFKAVLPARKVAKLYRAQEDFKRELLKKIQERKENKR